MATKAGPSTSVGNGVYCRLVLTASYSPTSVTSSTTSVTVSWTLDIEMLTSGGSAHDTGTWTVSGSDSATGSKAWSVSGLGDKYRLASGSDVTTLQYGSTQSWSLDASLNNPVLPDLGMSPLVMTLPARPYSRPSAPTGLTVTRQSDTSQKIDFTRVSTTGAPVTNIEISRAIGSGSFTTIATVGNVASYLDTKTSPNQEYRYRARATNSAGASDWSNIDSVDTTPNAPSKPTVQKQTNGDILVGRGTLPSHATHWQLWHAANDVWDAAPLRGTGGTLGGLLTVATESFAHPAPDPTKTHKYRHQAVTNDPVLYSAMSVDSDVVRLQAPPNGPGILGPLTAKNALASIVFSWKHNPVDTTAQTAYEARWRVVGSATWITTGKILSTTQSRTWAPGTFANGTVIEWQVRTWGAHATAGEWSVVTLLTLSAPPVVSFESPGPTWGSSTLVVSWTYFDPEGTEQASYRVRLWLGGEIIDTAEGGGPATQVTFTVDDATTYNVDLVATDGDGISSDIVTTDVAVTYQLPPVPTFDATFHPQEGYTEITVMAPAPSSGQVALDHLDVERLEGDRWIVVATGLEDGETILDMIPPLGKLVDYRVRSVSALPSYNTSQVQAVDTATGWVFFNYGPGFLSVVKMWGNLDADLSHTRAKELEHFTDRDDPVEFAGRARTRAYSVSGFLFAPFLPFDPTSQAEAFLQLADAPAPICVRDPESVKMFCSVSTVPITGHLTPSRRVEVAATRISYMEGSA